jgi:hypothetical protein
MSGATFTIAASGLTLIPELAVSEESDVNIIGPKKGYSPQIGTLVSMMTWMRSTMLMSVKGMSQKDLDYLFDANSNTIGSLLMHLARLTSFIKSIPSEETRSRNCPRRTKKWGVAMELGSRRKAIKGHDLDYYLTAERNPPADAGGVPQA